METMYIGLDAMYIGLDTMCIGVDMCKTCTWPWTVKDTVDVQRQ